MEATLLTLGVLLLLVGLVGQVKAKEIEVGTRNPAVRVILGIIGAAFIIVALRNEIFVPGGGSAPPPSTVPATVTTTQRSQAPAPPTSTAAAPTPETSEDATGRLVDRTDYPFVDDPAAIGTWRAVDFVPEPAAFAPGQKQFPGELALGELRILPGGRTSMAWRWTKGLLLHDGDHTASRYEIRSLSGDDYLILEWKSGDYTVRHQRPSYYVLKRER